MITLRIRVLCWRFLFIINLFFLLIQVNPENQFAYCENANVPLFHSVKDFGAKGDGQTLDTQAIQDTIQACDKNGGGTVVFPSGKYLTGAITIPSNVILDLQSGAIIQASSRLEDYQIGGKIGGFISAINQRNVGIIGQGRIEGSGQSFMDMNQTSTHSDLPRMYTRQGQFYMDPERGSVDGPVVPKSRPGNLLVFAGCQNVRIQDITIHDAPFWTIHIGGCNEVHIDGITIDNPPMIPNNDGIHCTTSRNVFISHCSIHTGDDAIAINGETDLANTIPGFIAHTGLSENIFISDCLLQSRSSGIRIGYGSNSTRNVTVHNIIIETSNRGLGIFVRDEGSIENIFFSDIVIHTRLHTGNWWGHGEPIHISAVPRFKTGKLGEIQNVRFQNIHAEGEHGIVVYGCQQSAIRDLLFDSIQLTITNSPLNQAYGGNFDLQPTADPGKEIFKHDISGFYFGFVTDLTLRNCEVRWANNLPTFFTHAIECEYFINIDIDHFTGRQSNLRSKNAAIFLRQGKTVSVRNCIAQEGTEIFLQQESVFDPRFFVNNDLTDAEEALIPKDAEYEMYNNSFSEN